MPTDLDLATRFFLQLAVILAAAHGLALVLRRIGQPEVVAHMLAGLLLGASGLGWIAPELSALLFPATAVLPGGTAVAHPSQSVLYVVGQLGVVCCMFCVGLGFDTGVLRRHARESSWVAAVGLGAPVLGGGLLGLLLAGDDRLFPPDVADRVAVLFVAAAVAVAALPVLARIVAERGLTGTRAGTIALGGAVADDVAAWTLLAVAIATHRAEPLVAVVTAAGTLLYVAAVLVLGRPLLRRLAAADGRVGAGAAVVVLGLLMLGAWFTELVQIYAVFGAFVLGLATPLGPLADRLRALLEPVTLALLLPVFFVHAGAAVRLAALDSAGLVLIAALVVAAAFATKAGACALASRAAGASWRDAAGLGVLMNARGLTGLVLIGIGLREGLITGAGYTLLAIAILATTVAVAPGLALVDRLLPADAARRPRAAARQGSPG
ncbi:cation:proton antiporter [Allonocardiopsis opalescens]|uniref:Transporter (CPA2 family) n=1 Tax=Allonocardiopsis opalescens TaxID=1144618 RepID=A0A2T0Q1K4_9ACTN|nr:cation:proton antiporter [Allonocardiopsis opalescens]PRX97674.1 transporter (CPA2 family) [Allonocardiopsis opalescens]